MLPFIEKARSHTEASRFSREGLTPPFIEDEAHLNVLQEIVGITDNLARPFRDEGYHGSGDCGFEGTIAYYVSQSLADQYPLEVKAVNLWILEHIMRGGSETEVLSMEQKLADHARSKTHYHSSESNALYPETYRRTFGQHTFCLLKIENRVYAIDTTFRQFFPHGTEDKLAQSIIDNGFFELTPENIYRYGLVTSDPDFTDNLLPIDKLNPLEIYGNTPLATRDLMPQEEMLAYLKRGR